MRSRKLSEGRRVVGCVGGAHRRRVRGQHSERKARGVGDTTHVAWCNYTMGDAQARRAAAM